MENILILLSGFLIIGLGQWRAGFMGFLDTLLIFPT